VGMNNINGSVLDRFAEMPGYFKMIGVGAFITAISVFLPWYRDLDAFNTGDKFIGLSGPLYLLGFLVMGLALFSMALFLVRIFGGKMPKFPLSESHNHMFVGVFNLFLLLITNSIYFHSKFGVNITMKEMRFGMMIAFVGSALVLVGGMIQNKKRAVSFETEGKLDPLIDVERNVERTSAGIRASEIVGEVVEGGGVTEVEVKEEVVEMATEKIPETIKVNVEGDGGISEESKLF
jgi:hypothetical protein